MAKKASRPKQGIKPYRMSGRFGILNHNGQLWTCETFWSAPQARKYLDCYQHDHKMLDLRRHTIVPVKITIKAVLEKAHSR